MGKKGGKKTKASGLDALGDLSSELFKTLPPIKRSELTKVVEKLSNVTANLKSEPSTPAKLWEEYKEISLHIIFYQIFVWTDLSSFEKIKKVSEHLEVKHIDRLVY